MYTSTLPQRLIEAQGSPTLASLYSVQKPFLEQNGHVRVGVGPLVWTWLLVEMPNTDLKGNRRVWCGCVFSHEINHHDILSTVRQGFDLLDPSHDSKKLEDLPKVTLMEDEGGNIHLRCVQCCVASVA